MTQTGSGVRKIMSEKGKEKASGGVPQTRGTEGDPGAASLGARRARRETDEGDPPSNFIRVQELLATVNNLVQKALSSAGSTGGLPFSRPSSAPAVVVATPLVATDKVARRAAEKAVTGGRTPLSGCPASSPTVGTSAAPGVGEDTFGSGGEQG